MIARGATFLWLVVVWLVLMESVTPAAILAGAVVAGLLMVWFRPPTRDTAAVHIHPLALARYLGRFLVDLVYANGLVAWAVIAPRRAGIRRAVVRVPVAATPDTATMILANAISLTPGTFIVEIQRDPTVFYVHVLQLRTVEDVHRQLWSLQLRLVRALGVHDAEATLEGWLADLDGATTGREG